MKCLLLPMTLALVLSGSHASAANDPDPSFWKSRACQSADPDSELFVTCIESAQADSYRSFESFVDRSLGEDPAALWDSGQCKDAAVYGGLAFFVRCKRSNEIALERDKAKLRELQEKQTNTEAIQRALERADERAAAARTEQQIDQMLFNQTHPPEVHCTSREIGKTTYADCQ